MYVMPLTTQRPKLCSHGNVTVTVRFDANPESFSFHYRRVRAVFFFVNTLSHNSLVRIPTVAHRLLQILKKVIFGILQAWW